ncbi:MAG: hypothetical protein NC192_06735, partial [Muribaculaceae bacterium]|nr:hypothetical protein [Muribaculaceae bacterium]
TYCAMGADKMWSSIVEFANRALEPFDFEEARTIFENPVQIIMGDFAASGEIPDFNKITSTSCRHYHKRKGCYCR